MKKMGPSGTVRSVERENRLREATRKDRFPTSQDRPPDKPLPKTSAPNPISAANKFRHHTDPAASGIKGNREKTRDR